MKQLLFIILLLNIEMAKATDTLHIITHNKETIVTNPSKGFNEDKRRGFFPSSKTPVRKIIL